jgi:EAL domain-containing protein (putative c-di-GMP-specific phosphodiesterase class I)/PAS domain-containing protein
VKEPQISAAAAGPAASLRSERDRFVALAFCWADILFELDNVGNVVYAAGPLAPLVGVAAGEVCGRPLLDLLAPADRPTMRALLATARRNERFGDDELRLYGPQGPTAPLSFSGYRLADLNGHYFIAMRTPHAGRKAAGFGRRNRDHASGLLDSGSFIDTVTAYLADGNGDRDALCSLIVLPDYAAFRERLAAGAERDLLSAVGERLQAASLGGDAASRLGDDRYALLHGRAVDLASLTGSIADLTREADPQAAGLAVASASVQLDAADLTAGTLESSVRAAVSQFQQAMGAAEVAGLSGSLSQLAQHAAGAVQEFSAMIADGTFGLELRPVLDARSGAIVHLEVLAKLPPRFADGRAHGPLALAEASGTIVQFELAMLRKVVDWIQRQGPSNRLPLVMHISLQAMTSLTFLARLDLLLREEQTLRSRLIFDVSLPAGTGDPARVNDALQRVRDKGILIGLADFCGNDTGFAGLAALDVDIVRFAGAAIAEAGHGGKAKALLRGLTSLCRELGVAPAAQDIDDEGAFELAKACGFEVMQGALFGPPSADLKAIARAVPSRLFTAPARR